MVRRSNDRHDDSLEQSPVPPGARAGRSPRVQVLPPALKAILVVLALAVLGSLRDAPRKTVAVAAIRHPEIVVRTLAFSRDGRTIAACGLHGPVIGWDSRSGRVQTIALGDDRYFTYTKLAPGARVLAFESLDATLSLWDLADNHLLVEIPGRYGPTGNMAFSADGSMLAVGCEQEIQVWETARKPPRKVCVLGERRARSLAFAPNGRMLAVGMSDGSIRIWDPTKGQRTIAFGAHGGAVASLAFADDGRTLASTCATERVARLWNVDRGQLVATLVGHTMPVQSTVFTPGSRLLATAGADGSVRLWDAATGQLLETFSVQDGPFTKVTVSPDGRLLAGGGNGSIWVWSLDPTSRAEGRSPSPSPRPALSECCFLQTP